MSLILFVDLEVYGQRLMEEQCCAMTDCGMVCWENGLCLKTSLTPTGAIQCVMEGMTM